MLLRKEGVLGEGRVDRFQHLVIGSRRWRGFHMRDHMRGVIVTRLGHMHLIADPGYSPLQTVARLQIIGEWTNRGDGGTSPSCRQRGGSSGP
jgi:hypothetical protein